MDAISEGTLFLFISFTRTRSGQGDGWKRTISILRFEFVLNGA